MIGRQFVYTRDPMESYGPTTPHYLRNAHDPQGMLEWHGIPVAGPNPATPRHIRKRPPLDYIPLPEESKAAFNLAIKAKGLTLVKVARAIGTKLPTLVSTLTIQKKVQRSRVIDLCRVLDLDAKDFIPA